MTTGTQRRSYKNVKLTQMFHLYYMGIWVALCICLIILLSVSMYRIEAQAMLELARSSSSDYANELANRSAMITRLMIGSLIFLGLVIALAVITAHRIAGPYIALRRTIEAIARGDTDERLHFRQYDRLSDLEKSFNRMVDRLQGKDPGPTV